MDHYQNAYSSTERPAIPERELLEWLASFSPRHEAELHRLQWAEAEAKKEARRELELLEFIAAISGKPEHQRELHALRQKEAEQRESHDRSRWLAEEEKWVEADHPREPKGTPDGGKWVAKDGGGGSVNGEVGASGRPPVSFASYSGPKRVVAQQVSLPSVGHHWGAVGAVFDKDIRPLLSDDAVHYALGSYSGATDPAHGFRKYGGVSHRDYNLAVKDELKNFLKTNKIKKMTKEQMEQFIGLIKNGRGADGKPHTLIGQFNRAIKSAVPKGTAVPTKMDDILAAGRKYLKHPRFRLLAAAAILSGVLSDAVASQVQSLDVTSESGHYKKAIQALHDGNLDRAYRLLTDDKNSLYTEIMDKVSPLAALRFKQKMDEEFDNARHREYK
jgi:hypothetical protein